MKWIPGVAFAILAVWLLASGRGREAGRHVLAFGAVFVLVHLPFLIWSPSEATYAYRYFGDQGLTGESVWYLSSRRSVSQASLSASSGFRPTFPGGRIRP